MTTTQQRKLEAFHATCAEMRDAGFTVVASLAIYGLDGSYQSVHVATDKERDPDLDHVLLEAIHEITSEWTERAH
jgi:hypothetical protein